VNAEKLMQKDSLYLEVKGVFSKL